MIYCDTSYLVRAYLDEPGSDAVHALFSQEDVASAVLIQAEVPAAFHRSFREGRHNLEVFQETPSSFEDDLRNGVLTTLALDEELWMGMGKHYSQIPQHIFLRSADALHLACAAAHGFHEVYSNDRHFLTAAPLFGLKGVNIISV